MTTATRFCAEILSWPLCDFGVLHFALKRLAQVVTQAFYVFLTTLHIEVSFVFAQAFTRTRAALAWALCQIGITLQLVACTCYLATETPALGKTLSK